MEAFPMDVDSTNFAGSRGARRSVDARVVDRHVVRSATRGMSTGSVHVSLLFAATLALVCPVLSTTAGCGGKTPPVQGDDDDNPIIDAPKDIDAPPDAPPGPCTLPSLSLTVATLAGCGENGTTDGVRDHARFSNPVNVVLAQDGSAFVADFDTNRIRKVDPTGSTTTILSALPSFQRPFGLALAPDGTLYAETDDNDLMEHSITTGTVWRVDTATGAATVVARNLGRPRGLAVLTDGKLAMSDQLHHTISILDPVTAGVTLLAGTTDAPGHVNDVGAAARFSQPYDLALLPDGDLAVADFDNHRIRRVKLDGTVSDLAGAGAIGDTDGDVATATFHSPKGITVMADGTIFVTDADNHDIRQIAGGQVTKLAGTGVPGWKDSNDPLQAQLYGIEGIDTDGTTLLVADGNNGDLEAFNRIRVIHLADLAAFTHRADARAATHVAPTHR